MSLLLLSFRGHFLRSAIGCVMPMCFMEGTILVGTSLVRNSLQRWWSPQPGLILHLGQNLMYRDGKLHIAFICWCTTLGWCFVMLSRKTLLKGRGCDSNRFGGASCSISVVNGKEFTWSTSNLQVSKSADLFGGLISCKCFFVGPCRHEHWIVGPTSHACLRHANRLSTFLSFSLSACSCSTYMGSLELPAGAFVHHSLFVLRSKTKVLDHINLVEKLSNQVVLFIHFFSQ
ncbi:unnamed protein product [Prunus brigantina]